MSPLYRTSVGDKVIAPAPMPDSAYRSSDVIVYQVTLEGLAKIDKGIPIRELKSGIDLEIADVIPFRQPKPISSMPFNTYRKPNQNLTETGDINENQ